VKTIFKKNLYIFLFISQILFGCRQTQKTEQTYKTPEQTETAEEKTSLQKKQNANSQSVSNNIPKKVYDVLKYVRENNTAPDGYVGGRKFGNFENLLPKKDENGRRINYQEWDVNPKQQGRNRGVERLITGSGGKVYFTKNHYKSFVEIL
jgi:ribonuclease T1